MLCLVAQLCPILCDFLDFGSPGFSVHGDSPGMNWSGFPCPPPGNLPNPGLPHLQADYLLSHLPGRPKSTEMGGLSFFRGSSQRRSRTRVFCIVGGFFISWATREAQPSQYTWNLIGSSEKWNILKYQRTNFFVHSLKSKYKKRFVLKVPILAFLSQLLHQFLF